jgi:esterase FrsA
MFDKEPGLPTASPTERDGPRSLDNAKAWMLDRAGKAIHPMNNLDADDVKAVLEELDGLDPVRWAAAWGRAGEAAWEAAKAIADPAERRKAYLRADGFFFMGRFPCPNHPDKLACAVRERDAYLAAGALFDPPLKRITVPFAGAAGEGDEVVFYYRRPLGVTRPPVLVMWGGVDAWKEQMTAASDLALALGIATVAVDGPGTGESPVHGTPDAERQFLPVLDWAAEQDDLDGAKVGLLGRSFGGYWATKLAHVVPDRVAAAVNWGGGAHFMFQPEWIRRSRHPDSYLMELVETRMRMLGVDTEEDYVKAFARLSLLDQGLLDGPSAPLLLVNGRGDNQCPVADIDLLVGHGSPKAVRMFPGGHMGITPTTLPTIIDWLGAKLLRKDGA